MMLDTPESVLFRINLWETILQDKRISPEERERVSHYYELAQKLYQKLLSA
jgi:hypothetical protein